MPEHLFITIHSYHQLLEHGTISPLKLNKWNLSMLSSKKKKNVPVPKYFYTGKRKVQILHTRLRTNCSSLNLDIFIKNISDSPMCTCGSVEDTQHYFFHSINFRQQRTELFNEISQYCIPTLNLILYGDLTLSLETNVRIFQAVHKYICNTQRF